MEGHRPSKVSETGVGERGGLRGWASARSMVLPDYCVRSNVRALGSGTSVLRLRNVGSIGRKDRWWQSSAVRRSVSPLNVWIVEHADLIEEFGRSGARNIPASRS